jgi:hypothetical protein
LGGDPEKRKDEEVQNSKETCDDHIPTLPSLLVGVGKRRNPIWGDSHRHELKVGSKSG